jgi:hypothetical protein
MIRIDRARTAALTCELWRRRIQAVLQLSGMASFAEGVQNAHIQRWRMSHACPARGVAARSAGNRVFAGHGFPPQES